MEAKVTVYVDSDFAGCAVTRKSTAGGAILWGGRLLKTWSKTMAIIALSSGEAELGAVTRGLAEGLGVRSVLADFGVEVDLELLSDATAAIGMCRRLGLGRVRDLATADLWVQQRVKSGEVTLGKLPGVENPADAMTKNVPASDLEAHCRRMGLVPAAGRPASVPANERVVIGFVNDLAFDDESRREAGGRPPRALGRAPVAGLPLINDEPGVTWTRRPCYT